MDSYLIHEKDTVLVSMQTGHKTARCAIKTGDIVYKYGFPIGKATADIAPGELVHSHNLTTTLGGSESYVFHPFTDKQAPLAPFTIQAYKRSNEQIGIRNDVWILPTVGCVNSLGERLAAATGAFCFSHPYGCSQLGGDQRITQLILRGLLQHPNAGGVLMLGLGCENNNIAAMQDICGKTDENRILFLNAQDCEDEFEEGLRLVRTLQATAAEDKRETVSASRLKIGLKCGGSDGFSGITANPLVGRVTDALVSMGAACALTEVPEMFGAEALLFGRCSNQEIFDKSVQLVNRWKNYFITHGQPVSENPSPGNKAGGITTLEEKSLGCVQKGGHSPVTDVLSYGDRITKPGLNLLDGPGNDMVSVTNLTAAGCHLLLFTTGRGTPLGAPVPTVKIATNTALAQKKPHWIDFDAQCGTPQMLLSCIRRIADGEQTANEKNNCRSIAIFKDGVTL